MPSLRRRAFVLLAATLLAALLFAPRAGAQHQNRQIQQQFNALENRINTGPDADQNWKDAKPNLTKSLAAARENFNAGRTYLALAQLGLLAPDLTGLETLTGSP